MHGSLTTQQIKPLAMRTSLGFFRTRTMTRQYPSAYAHPMRQQPTTCMIYIVAYVLSGRSFVKEPLNILQSVLIAFKHLKFYSISALLSCLHRSGKRRTKGGGINFYIISSLPPRIYVSRISIHLNKSVGMPIVGFALLLLT